MTGSEPQQHKAFSKIVLFLCSVIFVFVFSAVANYVIDPTGAFFQRERILRPAIAPTVAQMSRVLNGSETECHDFLIGTSVVLVLDTTVLKQEPCKLTFYGKGIQSYIKGLNLLLDQGIKINSLIVFISYDQYYNQDRFDYTKSYILGLDYPSDLYETLFYLKTLLFLDLYETIRQISLPPSTDQFPKWNEDLRLSDLSIFSSLKYRWDTTVPNVPWPSQAARNNAVERLGPSTLVTENREYQPEAFKVLLQEIVTLSRENNFKVTFVRPPNFYKNIVATHKQEFLDSYRQLLEVSEYYDFSFDIQYLRDPSLWIDMNHYNQEVASRVMDDLSHQSDDPKFGKKITKENMDEHLEALERDVYTYFLDQKPYPPNTIVHETWLDTQK